MDIGRFAYDTKVLFFRDSSVETTMHWYRAADDAKYFPQPHKWGSLLWYSRPWEATGVGEIYGEPRKFNNGFTPPTSRGQDYFGPLEFFQDGCPFDSGVNVPRDNWGLAKSCTDLADCFILVEGADQGVIEAEDGGYLQPEDC